MKSARYRKSCEFGATRTENLESFAKNYVKKRKKNFPEIRENSFHTSNFQLSTKVGRRRRKRKRCRACVRVTWFHPATLNAYEPSGIEEESQEGRGGLVKEPRVDQSIDPGTNLSALSRALVTTPSPLEGRKSGGIDYGGDKKRQRHLEKERDRERERERERDWWREQEGEGARTKSARGSWISRPHVKTRRVGEQRESESKGDRADQPG